MKQTKDMKRILGLASLLMLFAACEQFGIDTKETIMPSPIRDDVKVYASIEQPSSAETKVYADADLKVLWNANDTISFFNKLTLNEKWKFIGEEGDNVGQFEQIGTVVETGNDLDYYCAVYPYRSATRISSDNLLTVTLPATQTYAENSFGRGMNTMVAVSPTSVFTFKNVCGYLSFKLYGEGVSVSSITLKGNNNEPLAGNGTIPMAIESLPKITMSDVATKEITLTCNPPVALGKSAADYTEFWMVVPPTVFESGFTVTIKAENGMTIRKSLSNSLEIERSKIKRMAPLEVVLPVPEAVDLGLPSGLKWASFNVGATSPEEYGDHYTWGDTEPTEGYTWWTTYKYNLGTDSNGPFSKYVVNSYLGTIDDKTILDPEDDAANENWGGSWRMPTNAEWEELLENCIWTLTTQNGVNGRRVVSNINGNSIFLPAAGYRRGEPIHGVGELGHYWSSSLNTNQSNAAWSVTTSPSNISRGPNGRYGGKSIRPVYAPNHVASVSLDKADMTLFAGDSTTLIATLAPSAVLIPSVSWSSSDNSIATVDYSGKVKAVSPGNATITVTTTDGGKTASCNVTVKPQPEAIDLGLPSGLKWASFNLGATVPEEYGDYYAWGETITKSDYVWSSYKWGNSSTTLTKYCTNSANGTVDDITELQRGANSGETVDDAVKAELGGKWRMPTKTDFEELIYYTQNEWATYNGVNGWKLTSKTTSSNWIFLPAAGYCGHASHDSGSIGRYWSSSLNTDYPDFAYKLFLDSSDVRVTSFDRYFGLPIRPVYEE